MLKTEHHTTLLDDFSLSLAGCIPWPSEGPPIWELWPIGTIIETAAYNTIYGKLKQTYDNIFNWIKHKILGRICYATSRL